MKTEVFEALMRGVAEARAHAWVEQVNGLKVHVQANVDVAAIRRNTGLSQMEFARRIGVSSATLRNWEQGRRAPEGPARVLLVLLARNPRIVEETLGDAA